MKAAKKGENPLTTPEIATCMSHIVCSRIFTGAKKAGGLLKNTDSNLNNQIGQLEQYNGYVKALSGQIEKELLTSSKESKKWMDLAVRGHGGAFLNEMKAQTMKQTETKVAEANPPALKDIQPNSPIVKGG